MTKLKEYGIDKNTQLERFKVNKIQHDLLIGSMLGDGSLWEEGGNYRFRFRHAENQKEYCQFKLNYLIEFCKTKELHISNGNKKSFENGQLIYYFNTRALPCFNKYGVMNNIEILKELNENSFSIWMMDDGYFSDKGLSNYYTLSIKRFKEDEVAVICNKLEEMNLNYKIHGKGKSEIYTQSTIYFPTSETQKIKNIILNSDFGEELSKCMGYKLK